MSDSEIITDEQLDMVLREHGGGPWVAALVQEVRRLRADNADLLVAMGLARLNADLQKLIINRLRRRLTEHPDNRWQAVRDETEQLLKEIPGATL